MPMKKLKALISTALCLCAVCALALPAHALECVAASSVSLASAYGESSLTPLRLLSPQSLEGGFVGVPQIDAPGDPAYGKSTSFEPVVTADGGAMKNENLSKSAALIAPGFGTPTASSQVSYPSLGPMGKAHSLHCSSFSNCDHYVGSQLDPCSLNTGEYLTPNLVPSQMAGAGQVNGNVAVVAPPAFESVSGSTDSTPGSAGGSTTPSATVGFTEVTSSLYYSNGSLGTLKIPSIGLTVGVYEGTDSAALLKGAGHFTGTSIWLGNICVAGHNRGVRNDFGKIHTLQAGDIITFSTRLGTRTYAVNSVSKVSVNDVSGLNPSSTNMITLYTCVNDQPAYRWCVTAVAVNG